MKTIGVLLPQSKAYPTVGKEFMNGLKLALNQQIDCEFKIEGIGFGNQPNQVIDGIQKLIGQNEIDAVTGLLGHKGLPQVLDFANTIEEPMIYADLGATLPVDLSNMQGIYCNSLELCNSTYLLGKYYSNQNINNIGISTCYYDAGYGFIEAMEKSFTETENTAFAGHYITPLHPRENEAEIMNTFVEECKPDAIFGFHNGIFAKEHASFLKQNSVNQTVPLYTTPFSLGDSVLNEFAETLDNTYCISSWIPEMDNEENQLFIQKYEEKYNKKPSPFSLLGYENGLLIMNLLIDNEEQFKDITGPRGKFSINPKTNRTEHQHYLWQYHYKEGNHEYKMVEQLKDKDNYQEELKASENQDANGWHNAYLCH